MSAEAPRKVQEQPVETSVPKDVEIAAQIAKRLSSESERFRADMLKNLPDRHDRKTGVEL